MGGGFLPGGGQGKACVFPGNGQAGVSLVSVAVVKGDVITPIRIRYPDLVDLTLDAGVAEWSASVSTLWLVTDGPKTVIVTILGSSLTDDQLQQIALQLGTIAEGRI